MKILRIIARLNVGGPARHVVWLTDALNDEEFESVLVAGTVPPTEEDMGYFAEKHGVTPVFIEEMSRELSPKDALSLWKVWRTVLREKPDIVHTHTAKAGTVGRAAGFLYKWLTPGTLIGRPRRVRLVHTYHGHIFHSYYGKAKTRFFLFVERTLARIATDRIIVITEQQRKEIHEDFRVGKAAQFTVVPLGIDLSEFADAESKRWILREEIGAEDDDLVVGIVGRLTEIKDHELFLRAVGEINHREHGGAQRKEGSVRFVVIGDGHRRGELEALAGELGIADKVTFLGNREDPDVFYAGLDIVALTSKNEGTPLSLIEAMANRKPVVSTAVGGVVDLLGSTVAEGLVPASKESEVRSQEKEDRRRNTEDRSQKGEHGRNDLGMPRRGEMPLAPGVAEGGTRGEGDKTIVEPRSGDTKAKEPEFRSQKKEDRRQNTEARSQDQDQDPNTADGSPFTAHASPLTADHSLIKICERGIAVSSRDPHDFAEGLALLALDPGLRDRLAGAGFEFVSGKYDKARLIEDIKELYRSLSDEGTHASRVQ